MNTYWFERILKKLEERYWHRAIRHLPAGIVVLNAVVYVLGATRPDFVGMLTLRMDKVLMGQVWRLFTYLFIPPQTSFLFIFFALYFLYLVGTALEAEWGAFRLNCYYAIGMFSTTIIAVFFPHTHITNIYLNTSLFLAFATLYPEFTVYLFFILPCKMKYLAFVTWLFLIFELLFGTLIVKLTVLVSVLNYFLFFWPKIILNAKYMQPAAGTDDAFAPLKGAFHRCAVCGKTERDDAELVFRVCSHCSGGKEYCLEHINNHGHQ